MVAPTPKKATTTVTAPATSQDKDAAAAKLKKVNTIMLEEDDEFEDFPADDWEETADEPLHANHWEATWADDDEAEDFAAQLKSEASKRGGAQPMKI